MKTAQIPVPRTGKVESIYDTCLVPYLIAERACWSVIEADPRCKEFEPSKCQEIADAANQLLCDRAERHYQQKGQLFKGIHNKRKDPRQFLEMWMEHWFKSLLEQYLKGEKMSFKNELFIS